jgi:hypothetical protein
VGQAAERGLAGLTQHPSSQARAFFDGLLKGSGCDRNWYMGAAGELGKEQYRPGFAKPAPALFGDEMDICPFCAEVMDSRFGDPGCLPQTEDWRFGNLVGHSCFNANENILRIIGKGNGWNMCQNVPSRRHPLVKQPQFALQSSCICATRTWK